MNYSINNFTSWSNTIEWKTTKQKKIIWACFHESRAMSLFIKPHEALSALMNLSWLLWCTVLLLKPLHWTLRVADFHLCADTKKWLPVFGPEKAYILTWDLVIFRAIFWSSKSTCHMILDHSGKTSGRYETAREAADCPWVASVGKMLMNIVRRRWAPWT